MLSVPNWPTMTVLPLVATLVRVLLPTVTCDTTAPSTPGASLASTLPATAAAATHAKVGVATVRVSMRGAVQM